MMGSSPDKRPNTGYSTKTESDRLKQEGLKDLIDRLD